MDVQKKDQLMRKAIQKLLSSSKYVILKFFLKKYSDIKMGCKLRNLEKISGKCFSIVQKNNRAKWGKSHYCFFVELNPSCLYILWDPNV